MEPKKDYWEETEEEKHKEKTRKIVMIGMAIFFWGVSIYTSIYPPANFYDKYHGYHLAGLYIGYIGALFASFFVVFWDQIYHKWFK